MKRNLKLRATIRSPITGKETLEGWYNWFKLKGDSHAAAKEKAEFAFAMRACSHEPDPRRK